MMRTPILPLLLAILTAPALFFTKKWMPWFGVPTPDASLYPNVAAIVFFGVAFAIGWLMQSAKDPFSKMTTRWALNLMVAIGATAACLSLRGMAPSTALRGNPLDDCAFALLYALGVWSWTFALIGMSFRFLSKPSVVRRYLADASYWIYLMHLPIVMAIQVALARTSVHWSLKLTTIVGVTMMLLLVSYHLIVRNTLIGVLLNGKKAKERSEDAPDRSAAPVCAT